MLAKIKDAGLVGCGGAGFPTHAKLDCRVEYLIINGAECEPLLETDQYLLRHFARQIVSAAAACQQQVGAKTIYFALKEHYRAEIAAVEQELRAQSVPGQVFRLKNFYPAGDEQMIVYEVTGRRVPPGGLPLDVGVVVSNAATLLCVADALAGRPFTHKYLTVAGDVARPCVVRAPIGIALPECLAAAGESVDPTACYILGGPMMGTYCHGREIASQVVTKTISGVLVLRENAAACAATVDLAKILNRARSVCIQCRYCTDLCPRYLVGHPLEPHRIMRKLSLSGDVGDLLEDPDLRNAALCCECGICENYACPMGLMPRRVNAMLKGELARAGFRLGKGAAEEVRQFRDQRRVATPALVSRLGLSGLYGRHADGLVDVTADSVEILLKQHIGAPAQALVSQGEQVRTGQLIAAAPENALGVNMHSSIDGEVCGVSERAITIRRSGHD